MAALVALVLVLTMLRLAVPSWAHEEVDSEQYFASLAHQKIYEGLFGDAHTKYLSTMPLCYVDVQNGSAETGVFQSAKFTSIGIEDYLTKMKESHSAPINLLFSFQLLHLVDLSEKRKTASMVIVTFKLWRDCRLRWKPMGNATYEEIPLAPSTFRKLDIFTPRIRLLEALNPKENMDSETQINLASMGGVAVTEEFSTEFSCNIDVRMYPFDVHTCLMTFESILPKKFVHIYYQGFSLAVEAKLLVGRYTPSDQWTLVILPPTISQRYTCFGTSSEESDSECVNDGLQFRVILRRNPSYQLINLLFPAFLIVVISSCVFIVPPGGGDKMGLSVSILLSLYMFSQLMYDKMPETGSVVPLLSEYFLVCIGLVTGSCLYASLSSVFASACPRLPLFLRKFVMLLGPIFIFDSIKRRGIKKHTSAANGTANVEAEVPNGMRSTERSEVVRNAADFHGFSLDEPEKITWATLGALLDRLFFVLHLAATACVTGAYLIYGYQPWSGYDGLNLSPEDLAHVCEQLALQKSSQHEAVCTNLNLTSKPTVIHA